MSVQQGRFAHDFEVPLLPVRIQARNSALFHGASALLAAARRNRQVSKPSGDGRSRQKPRVTCTSWAYLMSWMLSPQTIREVEPDIDHSSLKRHVTPIPARP